MIDESDLYSGVTPEFVTGSNEEAIAVQEQTKATLKAVDQRVIDILEDEKRRVALITDLPEGDMNIEVEARKRYIGLIEVLVLRITDDANA